MRIFESRIKKFHQKKKEDADDDDDDDDDIKDKNNIDNKANIINTTSINANNIDTNNINADNIKGYFLSTSGRLVGVDRHGIVTTTFDTQNYCIEIVQQVGKNDFFKKAI